MSSQVPQPTLGSGLGLHCPYRRGIYLSTLPAQPIVDENGQQGAHWVSEHHRQPHAQARRLFTHLSCRLHSISILHQNATFAGGSCSSWISHFQLSYFLHQNVTFVFAESKCSCICQAVHFIFLLSRGSPIRVSPNGGRPFLGAEKVVVVILAA